MGGIDVSVQINKKLSRIGLWAITLLVSFVILFPLYWIFISSITPETELFSTPINYLPAHPTLDHYIQLVRDCDLDGKLFNTLFITICSISINVVICVMAAYGFCRHKSRGLSLAYSLIVFSMMIPAVVKARPLYTFFRSVNMLDTFPGLIILYTSNLIPFAIVILSNFLNGVPVSIDEAAEVDGATTMQKLFHVIIPLMRPAIATILMINFINCINDLFTPLFYANRIQTLSVAITTLPSIDGYSVPWELVSSMGWVIIFPIIIFVSIFERQIMDGIMAGGVKA